MASGFIILRDGRCLSVPHATHDALLRSVAASMEEGSALRAWLLTQVPGEADIELGYAFVRAVDDEHVVRTLDLRGLTEANRILFEMAARRAVQVPGPYAPAGFVASALERFLEMLDRCDRGEPPLEFSDWVCEAPAVEGRIGPGWNDRALITPPMVLLTTESDL